MINIIYAKKTLMQVLRKMFHQKKKHVPEPVRIVPIPDKDVTHIPDFVSDVDGYLHNQ